MHGKRARHALDIASLPPLIFLCDWQILQTIATPHPDVTTMLKAVIEPLQRLWGICFPRRTPISDELAVQLLELKSRKEPLEITEQLVLQYLRKNTQERGGNDG